MQFELFKPAAEETVKDFYAELPITIKITGNYHDIGAFASDVGKLSRIVTLNDIGLTPGKDSALIMDATAKTFRYLDEEEIATQRKAAAARTRRGAEVMRLRLRRIGRRRAWPSPRARASSTAICASS